MRSREIAGRYPGRQGRLQFDGRNEIEAWNSDQLRQTVKRRLEHVDHAHHFGEISRECRQFCGYRQCYLGLQFRHHLDLPAGWIASLQSRQPDGIAFDIYRSDAGAGRGCTAQYSGKLQCQLCRAVSTKQPFRPGGRLDRQRMDQEYLRDLCQGIRHQRGSDKIRDHHAHQHPYEYAKQGCAHLRSDDLRQHHASGDDSNTEARDFNRHGERNCRQSG